MSDWNNPFQHNLLNSKAQTFAATADIPGDIPVAIDLRKDKTKSRDPDMFSKSQGYAPSICASKHAVWIGIQPPPTGGPNKIVPFENNIVVAFWANDTSGGGILDPGAVIGGIGVMITDPKKYEQTVGKGLDIVWGRDNETLGDYTEAVAYTAVYVVTAPVRAVAAAGNWAYKGVKSWFAEEDMTQSFSATSAGQWLGLDYHNAAANAHKISIEITCRHNGVTRVVHDTELAGTSQVYDVTKPKPAVGYFVIDSPGQWKVRVRSLASGNCADPDLDVVETFTVASPPPTDESAAESHSALADRKITVPLLGLGAALLTYGLYRTVK